jgi:hypothetical protein
MSSSHLPQNKGSRDRILAWLQTFSFHCDVIIYDFTIKIVLMAIAEK